MSGMVPHRIGGRMERFTLLNDVPGNPAWKSAVDTELRRALDQRRLLRPSFLHESL